MLYAFSNTCPTPIIAETTPAVLSAVASGSAISASSVKKHRHPFQTVSPRLGAIEPHGDYHDHQDSDEDDIVAPADRFERDGVDEDVEDGKDCRSVGYSEAA